MLGVSVLLAHLHSGMVAHVVSFQLSHRKLGLQVKFCFGRRFLISVGSFRGRSCWRMHPRCGLFVVLWLSKICGAKTLFGLVEVCVHLGFGRRLSVVVFSRAENRIFELSLEGIVKIAIVAFLLRVI